MVQLRRNLVFILFLLMMSGFSTSAKVQDDVEILLLMDHQFGASVKYICEIFEGYGWNITTVSIEKELTSCIYATENVTVDLLVDQLGDISSQYDCLSIMPGSVHTNLLESNTVINMIRQANEKSMLITSWCRAISVLIEADIIQGKNVTGYAAFKDECEAKGANFILESPPIRDGNIITAVRSRYYRNETCELIKETVEEFKDGVTSISDVSGGNIIITLSTIVIYINLKLKKKISV